MYRCKIYVMFYILNSFCPTAYYTVFLYFNMKTYIPKFHKINVKLKMNGCKVEVSDANLNLNLF